MMHGKESVSGKTGLVFVFFMQHGIFQAVSCKPGEREEVWMEADRDIY